MTAGELLPLRSFRSGQRQRTSRVSKIIAIAAAVSIAILVCWQSGIFNWFSRGFRLQEWDVDAQTRHLPWDIDTQVGTLAPAVVDCQCPQTCVLFSVILLALWPPHYLLTQLRAVRSGLTLGGSYASWRSLQELRRTSCQQKWVATSLAAICRFFLASYLESAGSTSSIATGTASLGLVLEL